MSNAHHPSSRRERPTAKTSAAAASTTPVVHIRSPKDDAPEIDPTLWSTPDNCYISTLRAHLLSQQQPQQQQQSTFGTNSAAAAATAHPGTFLTSSWRGAQKPLTAAELAERRGLFHVVGRTRASNIFYSCMGWLCPALYARWYPELTEGDVRALPSKELARLMQLSLAAGEVEQSAMLARELSRRKLALQMELFPARAEMPSDTTAEAEQRTGEFSMGGTARGTNAETAPQWGAASSGVHPRAGGFSTAPRSWQPGPDASSAASHLYAGTQASNVHGLSYWAGSGGDGLAARRASPYWT